MKQRQRRILFCGLLGLVALLGIGALFPQTACTESTGSFTETFSDIASIDVSQSPAKFWYNDRTSPQGIATMNKLGANFQTANPVYVPGWINCCTANDFDLDGWPDYVATASEYCNVLALVRNMGGQGQVGTFQIAQWIDGSTGDGSGWPTRGVGGTAIDTSGSVSITSGDYDGDGDFDFLLITANNSTDYYIDRIWLYKNNLITGGLNTGVVSFTRTDLTNAWRSAIKGILWACTSSVSVDIDRDGDVDIVLGNYLGEVLKITNTNNRNVNASTFVVETTPLISTGWGRFGVSTVSVADFDSDGDLDMILGSVSYDSLLYYKNDGLGHFTLFASYTDPAKILSNDLYDGAATVSITADFDKDGYVDLVVGTDNWNYPNSPGNYGATGYGGKVFFFHNSGGTGFDQKLIFDGQSKSPQVYDFDLGMVFDYDQDGEMDFMIADGNHTQYYYLFRNVLADVYTLSGQATSINLTPALSSDQYAITRVQLTDIDQRVLGSSSTGLSVTYYVSNNDGFTWELYAGYSGSGIADVTNQGWHSFNSFGSRLRWKAALAATEDSMVQYSNASFETPVLDQIQLDYVYVDRREYSRTTDLATSVTVSGQTRKLIIAASFMFPGLEGQLRAYDVTGMGTSGAGYGSLQTVTAPQPGSGSGRQLAAGVSILWDAGDLLNSRSADDRTIYAAYKPGGTLTRIAFTAANASTLASLLADPNSDNAGLINFIRGSGRDWKLGDIQHSNPTLLGPPAGDPARMGTGYAAFATAWAARPKVVFVGANDGMLHCFDAATGAELWGFIPYNLLPKLKNLSVYDATTGRRSLSSDFFVDGSPAVADVQFGTTWKTILICGQARGKGSSVAGGLNYYFALDITDISNPSPIWEYTSSSMGETWSVPAIGRTRYATAPWIAFMGSGYDNDPSATVGNRFTAIRVDTGAVVKTFTASNLNTSSGIARPYTDIYVTIPGSPTAVDTNSDGYVESVYVGDLDGRIWKFNATSSNTGSWTFTAIYTDRLRYPIISKPAVWIDPLTSGAPPRIYFGTGGDDNAPADRNYAFIALKDMATPAVEWYIGDPTDLGLSASLDVGSFVVGDKAWADPVIADNTVYFSTLAGSIENVNPCLNLSQGGKLFGRFLQTESGGAMGATAFKAASGTPLESLQLTSKARRAVTVGDQRTSGGTTRRDIYIQEYDSTLERLALASGSTLKIKSWREVYRVIR